MVENCDFLKRLRNVHLEKSAVTGLFHPSCSPTTAKTPAKVHLRLRFQNLGQPRTAGLCGRAAGACDCGPLSCTKIERPSPLEKPSCKVRLFAQNRSRIYRQKVTVATLSPTTSHPDFQLRSQTAYVCFHVRSGYTRSALLKESHTAAYTPKQGAFRMGGLSLPSDCFTRFGNSAWPGFRTANFAAFGSWSETLLKNAESLRSSDALMRVAVPKASRPRWAA